MHLFILTVEGREAGWEAGETAATVFAWKRNRKAGLKADLWIDSSITRNPIRESWFEVSISVDWN
jgi:hypothetical protein